MESNQIMYRGIFWGMFITFLLAVIIFTIVKIQYGKIIINPSYYIFIGLPLFILLVGSGLALYLSLKKG